MDLDRDRGIEKRIKGHHFYRLSLTKLSVILLFSQSKLRERTGIFVDHTLLQSTLRELRVIQRSPRFWATFLTIVLIFALTGPPMAPLTG